MHKHTITSLESPNEPSPNEFFILGNYTLDSFLGNFVAKTSLVLENQMQENIFE